MPRKQEHWYTRYEEPFRQVIYYFLPMVLFIGGFIYVMNYTPKIVRDSLEKKLDAKSTAVITHIQVNKLIDQRSAVPKVSISNYEIDYEFHVGEQMLRDKDIIYIYPLEKKQRRWLRILEKGDSLQIRYQSQNPKVSLVTIPMD